jgi:molybdopterin-guanine dinucleotide biosynthesis protein A
VLAGGHSRRFGADKLAATYRGIPLLHHAISRLGEVSAEVIVVLAPDVPEPTIPEGPKVRFVRDAREDEGPLAGLQAGLAATSTDLALVTGGDMPELSTGVLLEMLGVAVKGRADAVALQDGDRFRPLPSLVRVATARRATDTLLLGGERSLRALLQALRVAVIDESTWLVLDPARGSLHDVDEPGDLYDVRSRRHGIGSEPKSGEASPPAHHTSPERTAP